MSIFLPHSFHTLLWPCATVDANRKIPSSWTGRRAFELVENKKLSNIITRFKFEEPVDVKPMPKFDASAYTSVWTPVDKEGPYGRHTDNLTITHDTDHAQRLQGTQ